MQRSLFRPRYLHQTVTSKLCLHHQEKLSLLPHHSATAARRKLRCSTLAQARKGLSELISLREVQTTSSSRRLKPHKISPRLDVPAHILRPPYVDTGTNPWYEEIQVHDAEGVEKMRAACRLAADVLEHAGTFVRPGVTTDTIDRAVHQMIIDNGAYPSPLTYGHFPKSVCTSVNECVCHGIPDSRQLMEGDIINVDVTVYLNGYHGDTSRMFYVGKVSEKARRLCEVTQLAMDTAIAQCGPGVPIRHIGKVIQGIADRHNYSIVKEFVGHGVGRVFHASPHVMPCRNNEPGVMQVGQTFTVEPILTDGNPAWRTWKDNWTVVTKDGSLAAQFEHTVLITENGHEVLTVWPSKR